MQSIRSKTGDVAKSLAGSGKGQSFSDRMTAMKHTISGSLIAKIICKATTEELVAPKGKHLDYLVQCTYEPRLSIPNFANCLLERTQHSNLVVVFKAFITIHHLMQRGHERFSQYIASNNCHFYLSNLNDRHSMQAHSISAFIKPYAKYLDAKAASYRELAVDLCRLKLGKEDGFMRTMSPAKLTKTIPCIENQLDILVAFDATSSELSNSVVHVTHLHLYRDLIRLYAVYNEAMINLIGRYFTMSKRDCRAALSTYKAFINRMEAMNTFVKVAEAADTTGILSSSNTESIAFQPVPTSVLEALEQHLVNLEGYKASDSQAQSTQRTYTTNTEPKNDLFASNGPASKFNFTEAEFQSIIEDERARLESFVAKAHKQAQSNTEAEKQMDAKEGVGANAVNPETDFGDLFMTTSESSTSATWTANSTVQNQSTPVWHSTASSPAVNPINKTSSSTLPPHSDLIGLDESCPLSMANNDLPFSSTTAIIPTPVGGGSSNPFQLVPQSNSPFVANPWYPNASMGPQMVNNNPFGQMAVWQDPSNSLAVTPNPLDAKLAQLAGTLSVRPSSSGVDMYNRPPAGPIASVNWTGTAGSFHPAYQHHQQLQPQPTLVQQTGSIPNSASLNHLTGPAVTPAAGQTNLWYYSAPGMQQQMYPRYTPTNSQQPSPWSASVSMNNPPTGTNHPTNPFI